MLVQKFRKLKPKATAVVALLFGWASGPLFAAIPVPEANSAGGGAASGMWAYGSGWVQDIILFGVPTVLGCVFLWMCWELWAKVQEQRNSKEPAWNGVIAFGGGSVLYFLVATYISTIVLNLFAA